MCSTRRTWRLDIGGDVSLSLITGLKLSAENVSLRDTSDNPLFDVERIDFALGALPPFCPARADITGITLNKPVLTAQSGRSHRR